LVEEHRFDFVFGKEIGWVVSKFFGIEDLFLCPEPYWLFSLPLVLFVDQVTQSYVVKP
jgi:hypothetical protein